MATRTINSWKERILTIMVLPLMSCSARLPVYTLLIGLSVPDQLILGMFNLQGLVLMGFYLMSFFAAIGVALVMKWFIRERSSSYFLLEMPAYQLPRWGNIGLTLIDRAKAFVFGAGKVILAVSIVLWALSSFGPGDSFSQLESQYAESVALTGPNQELDNQLERDKLAASYAGQLGKLIEPAIAPLGFDWKIGISIITSFAAREVFVGTMATIYSLGAADFEETTLKEKMLADTHPVSGLPIYSLATTFSLLVFYAFAMQCMSTLAITYKETKSWKWPALQFFYMTGLAYLCSLLVYQWLK
jgi:ferrous iron transport protein B